MIEALTKIYIKEGKSTFELEQYTQLRQVMTSAAEIKAQALKSPRSSSRTRFPSKSPTSQN
jgi:hypothetical protein